MPQLEDAGPKDLVNLTDPDAPMSKGKKGGFSTNYNAQIGCNEQQIINHAIVCVDHNDVEQLQPSIEGTQKNTKQKVKKAIADAGYSSLDNYDFLVQNNIKGYIPDPNFKKEFLDKPYNKHHFKYDKENNVYTCPEEKILEFERTKNYQDTKTDVFKGIDCEDCSVNSKCTSAKSKIRSINRDQREELREQMRERLSSKEGKDIYKLRFHPVESIFGHLKFHLGYTYFLVRGLEKVDAEFKLMCLTFNLRKLALYQGYDAKSIDLNL